MAVSCMSAISGPLPVPLPFALLPLPFPNPQPRFWVKPDAYALPYSIFDLGIQQQI